LWTASTVSTFGSEIAELALPLLALVTLSATAGEVALLRVAQFAPFLLATLPVGLLVDRNVRLRLRLMVGADVGRFVLFGAIPLAVWVGAARVELLYGVVFAAGILTVVYQVADFALLPSVVPADQLVDANGKLSASQSANEIGGRGLGGLLVDIVSAPAAVAVNAVSFLASAVSLRGVTLDESLAEISEADADVASADRRMRQELIEGLRVAVGHRYIRALLGEATTYNVFNEVFMLGLLLHAVRDLHLSAAAIGLIFTAGGVGSFVGAWFGSRVTGRFGYGRVLLVTLALGNTAPLALGLTARATLPLLCLVFAVVGVGIGVANVHAVSLRQVTLPDRLRGRVNAAYRLISWGAIPVGAAVGGVAAAQLGARPAMLLGAAGLATSTLWVAMSGVPRLRTIEDAAVPG
jgi:MFS family permease